MYLGDGGMHLISQTVLLLARATRCLVLNPSVLYYQGSCFSFSSDPQVAACRLSYAFAMRSPELVLTILYQAFDATHVGVGDVVKEGKKFKMYYFGGGCCVLWRRLFCILAAGGLRWQLAALLVLPFGAQTGRWLKSPYV